MLPDAVRSARRLAFALVAGLALGACPTTGLADNEVLGRQGAAVFATETALAFSTRLVVGSTFKVTFRTADADDALPGGARLASGDAAVVEVAPDGTTVTIVGPGVAELRVEGDGTVVDTVELHAGNAGATALVDGDLLAATGTVDARLPVSFAVRTDTDTKLLVSAVDKCGGDILDLHASTLVVDPAAPAAVPVAIDDEAPASFTVKTQVPGDAPLVLRTPGLDDLRYSVVSVDSSQIDEVKPAASASDGTQVTLWGRAFVDDVEIAGPVEYSWSASERVTLAAASGPVVVADVSFPQEGEPPDDRPALVTAELVGEEGELDLLTATTVTSRGTPARVLDEAEVPAASCNDPGAVCNPEAALLGLLALRGLRRMRRRVSELTRDG